MGPMAAATAAGGPPRARQGREATAGRLEQEAAPLACTSARGWGEGNGAQGSCGSQCLSRHPPLPPWTGGRERCLWGPVDDP